MFCSDIQNSSSKCRGFQIHRLNTNHVCQSDSLCFNCTLSEHFSKSLFRIRNYKIELKQSFENSFLIHNAIIQLEEIYACRFDLRVFVANLRISPEHTCTTLYIITKFRTLKDTQSSLLEVVLYFFEGIQFLATSHTMCTVGKYAFLEPKIGLLLKQLTLLLTYVVTNDERNLTYSPHFVVSSFSFLFFFYSSAPVSTLSTLVFLVCILWHQN